MPNMYCGLDGSPLLPPPAHAVGRGQGVAVHAAVAVDRAVCVLQPLGQERLQLAHVLE